MKSLNIIFLLLTLSLISQAQSDVIDNYIKEGFSNNQALKQQDFQLEKSVYALKEATGLFFPNLSFKTDYVNARGGRTIDIPVGDLMNPVYNNLNQINDALAPGSPKYPNISNVSEQLNPKNFYNSYFHTTLPLINAEIYYNRRVRKDQVEMQRAEVDIYKRELAKDIKIAYFNYLKATQAVRIFENAMDLVKESERVNQKLVDNGKEVVYALSRAKSEVSKISTQLSEAKNNQTNAQAYFNFLLNKSADSEIAIDQSLLTNALSLPTEMAGSASKREELSKLMLAKTINVSLLKLNKSSWIPKLGASFDFGSQASDFQFNRQSQYYLLGIGLEWNLFSGLRDVNKVKQAQMDIKSIDAQYSYVESQLKLASVTAGNTYSSAKEQYRNAVEQETTSSQYFTLMNKRYREGQALYIEYLDARNENTLASLQKAIKYYDAWIRLAELERANANFELKR